MEEAESTLAAGYSLDRYELLCPLATGGMATVWLARLQGKRGFEKLYAIKTIRGELSDDAHFEEMFLDEAHIAAKIQHPNVANILDLGEKDGVLYIVMEWVDGDSLAKVRKFAAKAGVQVPLGLSLRIIADACAGLHAAHELKDESGAELGVVHRDVSPQNILVATSGAVKVIDFGIAKAENRAAPKTRTGIVKGKLQYMAPEQAKAKKAPIDRRVDLWALGVCLYELISDRLPFDGDNQFEILAKVTGDEPFPPIEGLPDSVKEILEHTLARDPDERFASAAAMRRAIESAIAALGLPSTSEDVAAFVEKHMPDRAAKRKEVVGKALKEATERSNESAPILATAEVMLDARGKPVSQVSTRLAIPAARGAAAGPTRPVLSAREILERPSVDPAAGTLISAELAASAGIPRGGTGKRVLAGLVVLGVAAGGYVYYAQQQGLALPWASSPTAVVPAVSVSVASGGPSAAAPTLVAPGPPPSSSSAPFDSASASASPPSSSSTLSLSPSASPSAGLAAGSAEGGAPAASSSAKLPASPHPHAVHWPAPTPTPTSFPTFSRLPEPEVPTIATPQDRGSDGH